MKRSAWATCLPAVAALLLGTTSCSHSESYSDLLRDEEKAANWYLSNHRVCNELPADNDFETGENAPFYRMDEDGYLYMQVISKGNPQTPVEKGDMVYFLYSRQNIRNLMELGLAQEEGNEMNGSLNDSFFIFGETNTQRGVKYGKGLQTPLEYLDYHSEVNLVVKSLVGFKADQSECIPYIMNVKYLKPEY